MTRTASQRPHRQVLVGSFAVLGLGLLLTAATPLLAQAAAPSHENPADSTAPATVTRYTARAGDTLERIAQQQFKDSPLQLAVLVKALQEHNQLLIGEVRPRQRLKTGLVLELPSHEQMARKVLMPYLRAEPAQSPQASGPQQHKAWVRYP